MAENQPAPWDAIPGESAKAYTYFLVYRNLPPEERSVKVIPDLCGIPSKTAYRFSSIHKWAERARAWDSYNGSMALVVKREGLERFQEAVLSQETTSLALMYSVVNTEWMRAHKHQQDKGVVSARELVSMVNATEKLFAMIRRSATMPVNYRSQHVDEPELEQEVYYIGDN